MALLVNKTLENGVQVQNGYFRIEKIDGNKENMMIYARVYKDHQYATDEKPHIYEVVHYFVPSMEDDSPNNFKQGYEHLKTLPEFAGAVDVL